VQQIGKLKGPDLTQKEQLGSFLSHFLLRFLQNLQERDTEKCRFGVVAGGLCSVEEVSAAPIESIISIVALIVSIYGANLSG
jgi:hypothetical protein